MKLDDSQRSFLVRAIGRLKGTARQKEVAVAYVETGSEKAAAAQLGMKPPTAKVHMQKFYRKNGMDWIGHAILSGCHKVFDDRPHDLDDKHDDQSRSSSPPRS